MPADARVDDVVILFVALAIGILYPTTHAIKAAIAPACRSLHYSPSAHGLNDRR